MSDGALWKHLANSQFIAVVGIKEPQRTRGFFAGRTLLSEQQTKEAIAATLGVKGVGVPESERRAELRMPVMPDGREYPAVAIRIESIEALATLRKLASVDFVEPLYPAVVYADGIGCGVSAYPGSASDTARRVGTAVNLVPWAYTHHSIPLSWGLFPPGTAPGVGVDFFQTDTGVFASQRQFVEVFSPPTTPAARSFSEVLWGGGPSVKCSHGTRIAGLAAAPLDGSAAPNIIGIAWGSSLRSQKVGDGVVQFDTPTTGLAAAINEAATSTVALPIRNRILLMAWGMPWESQLVRDAIVSAYDANRNLIMVAAAGTVTAHVVFPATMRRETVAVSLVDAPNPAVMSYGLVPPTSGADTVGYGEEVDFVAVNNISRGLFVPTTGRGVDSAGRSVDSNGNLVAASGLLPADTAEISQLGGSSSAVSIIGGGLALVWSRMPSLTRDQVIDRAVAASSCRSISGLSAACRDWADHRAVGSGIPDFYVAAGGARSLWIDGPPPPSPGQTVTMAAAIDGDPALFSFAWSTGATGPTASVSLQPGQTLAVTLTAVNRVDNTTLTASRSYTAAPVTARTLYATTTLESYASFFDGHRVSAAINAGATLPVGCFVTGVAGQELTVGGAAPGTPFGTPAASANYTNRGFGVSRTAFGPQSLDVLATAWHDGLSAIRVRPVYFVLETAGVDCNSGGATQAIP